MNLSALTPLIYSLILNGVLFLLVIILLFAFLKSESIIFKGLTIAKEWRIEFERDKESAFAKLYKQNKRLRRRLAFLNAKNKALNRTNFVIALIFVFYVIIQQTNNRLLRFRRIRQKLKTNEKIKGDNS